MDESFTSTEISRQLVHSSRFFFVVTDLKGQCLFSNNLFNKKFLQGKSRPGFSFSSTVSPSYRDEYNKIVADSIKGKSLVSTELSHALDDGKCECVVWELNQVSGEEKQAGWIEWIGTSVTPASGVGGMDDGNELADQEISPLPGQSTSQHSIISQPKEEFLLEGHSLENIRQRELFFRALFADSLDGILLVDEKGTISYSSSSVKTIMGYEQEDFLGQNCFDFVHPDDIETCMASFQDELMEKPKKKYICIRIRKKSGEWLWCMVRGHNQFKNPAVGKMLIYFNDDTVRRNVEAELMESRERFLQLIQNLNVGVVLCDPQGIILLVNQTCLDIFGFSEEELVGRSVFDDAFTICDENGELLSPDQFPVSEVIQSGEPLRNRIIGVQSITEGDEIIWLQVNAQPVMENDVIKHIICSFNDITEQRILEKKFKLQEQQKQKQVMQATIDGQEKERSEISRELHDNISQHLTTTRLYLEVAREKISGQPFEMISQAHKGLLYIINEIRRLSEALAPPELRDIGLVESIADLCDMLKNLHAFNIDFGYGDFDEELIPDNMKLMLFRILQEQVNNILRHAKAKNIDISLRTTTQEVCLRIADDGIGYDPRQIKKGLGITNIISRVELVDGNVEIITSPGNGCILHVTAPLK